MYELINVVVCVFWSVINGTLLYYKIDQKSKVLIIILKWESSTKLTKVLNKSDYCGIRNQLSIFFISVKILSEQERGEQFFLFCEKKTL